jgi:Fe-S-cluster containining protein
MIELPIVNKYISNNENQSLCSACKGDCCTASAGFYHPKQVIEWLKLMAENKLDLLGKSLQIDYYHFFETRTYVLRPAHYNYLGLDTVVSNRQDCCVNLTDKGCSLSFENRPFICQILEPAFNKHNKPICKLPTGVHVDLVNYWFEYQHYFDSFFRLANISSEFYPNP